MSEEIKNKKGLESLWHSRGYLPHYDDGSSIQFVTFRLADSLPKHVIEGLRQDVKSGILSEIEYHRAMEKYLDNGFGNNYLRRVDIAELIEENLATFEGERYKLYAWVIMPNHVHILLAPTNNFTLAAIMHGIKSYTSHQANKLLGRSGQFWSKEYFDRYIRNNDHFARTVSYIELNPVKAKLCRTPEDWRFGSGRLRASRP